MMIRCASGFCVVLIRRGYEQLSNHIASNVGLLRGGVIHENTGQNQSTEGSAEEKKPQKILEGLQGRKKALLLSCTRPSRVAVR